MAYAENAIVTVRDAAAARAAKLSEKDPLRRRLQQLSEQAGALRSKIVATKEGGMITGEERIRELMGKVYGDVNNYEGRPTEYQARRADDLAHELEDVITEFRALTDKSLSTINASLAKKKLEKIVVPSEADWQKEHTGGGGGAAKVSGFRRVALNREE
jgi:sugar-specific transcriptional regulator TrmB